VLAKLAGEGILAGVDLGRFGRARERDLLVAVTERHSRGDLDRFVRAMQS
jgi:glycine dehydrogenase subunit 1